MLKEIGKVKPGSTFHFDGKGPYIRNQVQRGRVFCTAAWPGSGTFTDAIFLGKATLVDADESTGLTARQMRET